MCKGRIHTLVFSHVERVKARFNFKCSKRAHQTLWVYTTGMPFYKTSPMSSLDAMQMLNPAAKIPSQHALRGPLLVACYEDSIDRLRTELACQACTLVSDA
ncbi:Transposase [Phytophthora megakarya]|uniref:Transposase n=1 Tax=Phytophthora megakarya TaxID=4795 RepID=A0A225VCM9_9STRA|nr:Transposase [Phytophthora megakarya]